MSKTKYKKGDRVVCIKEYNDFYKVKQGTYGTIAEILCPNRSPRYGVIWDNYSEGSNMVKGSENCNGLYVHFENLSHVRKPVHRKRNVLMQYIQALFIKMKNHYKCCHSRMDGIVKRCDKRTKKTEHYISCVEEKVFKLGELCTNRFASFRNTEEDLRELRKVIFSFAKQIESIKRDNVLQLKVNKIFSRDIAALKKDVHEINPFVDTAKERYEQLKRDNDGDNENLYQKCERVMKKEPVNEQGYTMKEIKRHWNNGTYIKFNNNIYRKGRNKLYFHFPVDNYKLVFVNEFGKKGGQNGC